MTEQTKMQAIPKKNIIIILIALCIYALLFAGIAYAIDKSNYVSSEMSSKSLSVWKIISILLSLYALTTPWRWQKKIPALANKHNMSSRQIWGVLMLFCFVPFVAPLLYGLILLFWGLSFAEFCYFVALSVVGALAWSVYNLRKNS